MVGLTQRQVLSTTGILFLLVLTAFSMSTSETSPASSGKPSTVPSTAPSTTAKPSPSTPTLPPAQECQLHNKSCEECIKAANYKCFYCYTDNSCQLYPVGSILPVKLCDLSKARWGVCWVNFEALIITMSLIGGIIILSITCCCIRCFCCSGGNKKKYMKEDAKWERQKAERKQRSDERKADRKERMDEIRRKYGLVRDDTPYQRFDA